MSKEAKKELDKALLEAAGAYSKSLMNDIKHGGLWVRSITVEGKQWISRSYSVWNGINQRSRPGGSFQNRFQHYVGTTICKEWENDYQAFANWYTKQVGYKEGWDIDKDVLGDGKHYSPATCLLLPRAINLLFSKHHAQLNIRFYKNKKDGKERWFTQDGTEFRLRAEAEARARAIKVSLVESLKGQYKPLGIPEAVFNKALCLVETAE